MDAYQVPTNHRRRVQPQAGIDLTSIHVVRSRHQPFVITVPQDEPVDFLVEHAPNDVLTDAAAAVDSEFRMQVDAGAAGGDFGAEFRCPRDVAVFIDDGLATPSRVNEQGAIWLPFIFQVEPYGCVVAETHAASISPVEP